MSNTRNDGVHRDNNLFGCANPTVVMGNIIVSRFANGREKRGINISPHTCNVLQILAWQSCYFLGGSTSHQIFPFHAKTWVTRIPLHCLYFIHLPHTCQLFVTWRNHLTQQRFTVLVFLVTVLTEQYSGTNDHRHHWRGVHGNSSTTQVRRNGTLTIELYCINLNTAKCMNGSFMLILWFAKISFY